MICCQCRIERDDRCFVPIPDKFGYWDGLVRRNWCFDCWQCRRGARAADDPLVFVPRNPRTLAQDKILIRLARERAQLTDHVEQPTPRDAYTIEALQKVQSDVLASSDGYALEPNSKHDRSMFSTRTRTSAYVPEQRLDAYKNKYTARSIEDEQEFLNNPPWRRKPSSAIEQTSSSSTKEDK